ncbi:TPA: ribonuclease P [Candidatus Woesearchaeota archaeon]|nr:ribonuclease P [Candidatus Woesearchaeota archaeon]HIG93041.1 ribonuclease P [Candidatus Woesearchaeota archaeon]HIH12768.1 ribonuclease P [Candidatus Woesearchaeota archaeon]
MSKPLLPKNQQKNLALERINSLFQQAQEIALKNQSLANRYVILARKIAMKVKVTIPVHLRRRFCKHCYTYLTPGVKARVRTRQGKVIISCLECKKFMRIPIK